MISTQFLLIAVVLILIAGTGSIYTLALGLTFAIFVLYGTFAAVSHARIVDSRRAMLWLNLSFATVSAALAGRLAFERA